MNPYVAFLLYLVAILGFVAVTLLHESLAGPEARRVRDQARALRVRRDAGRRRQRQGRSRSSTTPSPSSSSCSTSRRSSSSSGRSGAQPVTGFMLATFVIFVFLLVLILLYVYQARLLEAVTD